MVWFWLDSGKFWPVKKYHKGKQETTSKKYVKSQMRQKPQNQQKATERFMKTPIESLTLQWQQISWGETHTPNGCTRNLHPRLNLQLDRVGVNVLGTYIVFGRGEFGIIEAEV